MRYLTATIGGGALFIDVRIEDVSIIFNVGSKFSNPKKWRIVDLEKKFRQYNLRMKAVESWWKCKEQRAHESGNNHGCEVNIKSM